MNEKKEFLKFYSRNAKNDFLFDKAAIKIREGVSSNFPTSLYSRIRSPSYIVCFLDPDALLFV